MTALRGPLTLPTENAVRLTNLRVALKTYGTDEQRHASIARLKQELELQGFIVNIQIVE